jgi:hypothetical protein
MKYSFFTWCCVAISLAGMTQEYAVNKIPESLLANADVVKRVEEFRYEVSEGNRARQYQKVAYTILNEKGDRWATFAEGYDKLRSIESFEGALYDASGKKLRTLKKSEIRDVSGSDDASLADDNRLKWHSFFFKVYPFTVEYEVEIHYKGTMFVPRWVPQERAEMSVQSAKLSVKTPVANPLRYKTFHYKGEPEVRQEKSARVFNWEVKDLPAIVEEYASPAWHELTTSVFMATEKFFLDDYEGSNASWKDFGKFVYDLKKDRDQLPEGLSQLSDVLPLSYAVDAMKEVTAHTDVTSAGLWAMGIVVGFIVLALALASLTLSRRTP